MALRAVRGVRPRERGSIGRTENDAERHPPRNGRDHGQAAAPRPAMSAPSARVSVCMATFNGARFVEAQVESILRELRPDDELVVSDDGSSDATLDKVRRFSDARVRILAAGRLGVAPNFEHALRHARGDCIFLSDQDDVWLPGKVELMCKALA